jgi:UDP-N-acetyl-D-galactosamine dehydrogenase
VSPATTVAVVGLGYVGLPLAVAFGKKFPTIGFDLSETKIAASAVYPAAYTRRGSTTRLLH